MADRFDVVGRMNDGRNSVEHFAAYLQACAALGSPRPDLTAAQLQDCYAAESGLDLNLLDHDCSALTSALNSVEEALSVQHAQLAELATGWRGSGADSAARFLQRHCDTAAAVAAHVRSAAQSCAALRDNLWQSVDGKVATTIAIDERSAPQRPAWLAAARPVTHSAADDVLRQQVIAFVDNDIRDDWLPAMHATAASIRADYDAAIHALTSAPDVGFEIPGDLGPRWQPEYDDPSPSFPTVDVPPDFSMPATPAPTVSAAAPIAPQPDPRPAQTGLPDEVPSGYASPLDDIGGLSSGASGLSGLGGSSGGIGGVIGSIVDGINSLIGSLAGGLGDPSDSDPLLSDPTDPDDPADADGVAELEGADATDPDTPADADPVATDPPAESDTESPPATAEAVEEQTASPPESPPADQPAMPAARPADGSTPCEIAEDQLPQVGQ